MQALSKLKAFAGNNFYSAQMVQIFFYDWVENFVGKRENASYHSSVMFSKAFTSQGHRKLALCSKGLKAINIMIRLD